MTFIKESKSPNVTKLNPFEIIYLKGNEGTDGSLRMIPDSTHSGTHFEFQLRTNGVWNITSIDVNGDTALSVGEGLNVGAAGPHFRSRDSATNDTFLHARTEYTDSIGSAEAGIAPFLDSKITRSILQPDDSGTMSGTTISWTTSISEGRLISRMYLKVSIAPTDNVTFNVKSTDSDGNLFFSKRLSINDLSVGEISIDLDGWINEETIANLIYFELVVDNSGTLSILSNISLTIPWYAYDYYKETHHHLAPMEYTTDSYIFDAQTELNILTTDGNMIATCPTVDI